MIESDAFVQALQDMGVNFFTGVPDSILGGIIAELMDRRLYTPAVREDEAVAMAAGAYMGGKIPAVQACGFGNPPARSPLSRAALRRSVQLSQQK